MDIACSLSSAGRATRAAAMAELARDALTERRPTPDGAHLRFRADPGVERRLRELVAAERECCPFLDLDLTARGGDLVLDVTAPPEASEIVEALFAE